MCFDTIFLSFLSMGFSIINLPDKYLQEMRLISICNGHSLYKCDFIYIVHHITINIYSFITVQHSLNISNNKTTRKIKILFY